MQDDFGYKVGFLLRSLLVTTPCAAAQLSTRPFWTGKGLNMFVSLALRMLALRTLALRTFALRMRVLNTVSRVLCERQR